MTDSGSDRSATVFIPPMLRTLTDGAQCLRVEGKTLREIIDQLEALHPGLRDRICDENGIRPELSVSIGDALVSKGLAEPIAPSAEIHFLPALGGG